MIDILVYLYIALAFAAMTLAAVVTVLAFGIAMYEGAMHFIEGD